MYPQLVLSDAMLKLLLLAKSGKALAGDFERIKTLLAFYKPHAINKQQYERIGHALESNYLTGLMQTPMAPFLKFTGSLEDLSLMTTLKLILDDKRRDFPYVNIKGASSIELNYTGTFKGVAKEDCKSHLKALCKNAKQIEIWDRYLYTNKLSPDESDSKCYELLKKIIDIVDNENVKELIIYDYNYDNSDIKKSVDRIKTENVCSHLKRDPVGASEKNYHDRYIKITSDANVLEVLLSSGFDNLFDDDKDFTYVVRFAK